MNGTHKMQRTAYDHKMHMAGFCVEGIKIKAHTKAMSKDSSKILHIHIQ